MCWHLDDLLIGMPLAKFLLRESPLAASVPTHRHSPSHSSCSLLQLSAACSSCLHPEGEKAVLVIWSRPSLGPTGCAAAWTACPSQAVGEPEMLQALFPLFFTSKLISCIADLCA